MDIYQALSKKLLYSNFQNLHQKGDNILSFAKDSKLEIIEEKIEDADCAQAFISGLLHASPVVGFREPNSLSFMLDVAQPT